MAGDYNGRFGFVDSYNKIAKPISIFKQYDNW